LLPGHRTPILKEPNLKKISTGFGLCVLGLGIAAWPVLDRLMPQANAVGVSTTSVTAVATAQGVPVALFVVGSPSGKNVIIYRLWNHGGVDRRLYPSDDGLTIEGGWRALPG
jgi:hypothetical protein